MESSKKYEKPPPPPHRVNCSSPRSLPYCYHLTPPPSPTYSTSSSIDTEEFCTMASTVASPPQQPPPQHLPSPDLSQLDEDRLLGEFVQSESLQRSLMAWGFICERLKIRPSPYDNFSLTVRDHFRGNRKVQQLLSVLDEKASDRMYRHPQKSNTGRVCAGMKVLIVGGGPVGLRTAIEAQLLGCEKVVVIEKRTSFTRHNALYLWEGIVNDLRNLGAKVLYGQFCTGNISHVSTRRLQLILLKVALLLGVEFYCNKEVTAVVEPSEDHPVHRQGWHVETKERHIVEDYNFDVVIAACGKPADLQRISVQTSSNIVSSHRFPLEGYEWKKVMTGTKEAIGVTANFKRGKNSKGFGLQQTSGTKHFQDERVRKVCDTLGLKTENFVYFQSDTHYFILTLELETLLAKKLLKLDTLIKDTHLLNLYELSEPWLAGLAEMNEAQLEFIGNVDLLKLKKMHTKLIQKLRHLRKTTDIVGPEHVDFEALKSLIKDIARIYTDNAFDLEFAENYNCEHDIAIFDFTHTWKAEPSCRYIDIAGYGMFTCLVGDSLHEPFWPMGTGILKGFLSAWDACWALKRLAEGVEPLQVLAEKEACNAALSEVTVSINNSRSNLRPGPYSIDPRTRYSQIRQIGVRDLLKCAPHCEVDYLEGPIPNSVTIPKEKLDLSELKKRDVVLDWVNDQFERFNLNVSDLWSSWWDGQALTHLVHSLCQRHVPSLATEDLDKAATNQQAINLLARAGIPASVTGRQVVGLGVNDEVVMLYYLLTIMERCCVSKPRYNPPPTNGEVNKLNNETHRPRTPEMETVNNQNNKVRRSKSLHSERQQQPQQELKKKICNGSSDSRKSEETNGVPHKQKKNDSEKAVEKKKETSSKRVEKCQKSTAAAENGIPNVLPGRQRSNTYPEVTENNNLMVINKNDAGASAATNHGNGSGVKNLEKRGHLVNQIISNLQTGDNGPSSPPPMNYNQIRAMFSENGAKNGSPSMPALGMVKSRIEGFKAVRDHTKKFLSPSLLALRRWSDTPVNREMANGAAAAVAATGTNGRKTVKSIMKSFARSAGLSGNGRSPAAEIEHDSLEYQLNNQEETTRPRSKSSPPPLVGDTLEQISAALVKRIAHLQSGDVCPKPKADTRKTGIEISPSMQKWGSEPSLVLCPVLGHGIHNCTVCRGRSAIVSDLILIQGRPVHRGCLKCQNCGVTLSVKSCFFYGEILLCAKDYEVIMQDAVDPGSDVEVTLPYERTPPDGQESLPSLDVGVRNKITSKDDSQFRMQHENRKRDEAHSKWSKNKTVAGKLDLRALELYNSDAHLYTAIADKKTEPTAKDGDESSKEVMPEGKPPLGRKISPVKPTPQQIQLQQQIVAGVKKRAKIRAPLKDSTIRNSCPELERGSLTSAESCHFCTKRVYATERICAAGFVFHKHCLKCETCGVRLRLSNYVPDKKRGKFYCFQHGKHVFQSDSKLEVGPTDIPDQNDDPNSSSSPKADVQDGASNGVGPPAAVTNRSRAMGHRSWNRNKHVMKAVAAMKKTSRYPQVCGNHAGHARMKPHDSIAEKLCSDDEPNIDEEDWVKRNLSQLEEH